MPARPRLGARGGLWPPLVAGAVFYGVFIGRSAFSVGTTTYFSLFDDAMISLTYARTLAEGAGLIWQPGGPAIEGYTNLLWTLWMSLLHLLPVAEAKISLLVMLTGAGLLLANIVAVHAIARRLFPGLAPAPAIAAWLTALFYPLAYWTLRGMEVGLVALLISAAVLVALRLEGAVLPRSLLTFGVVMAAGVLTRTDAIVPLGLVATYAVWRAARRRVLVAVAGIGVLGATLVGHTLFRIAYYGEALPNTYYLKLGGIGLSERIGRGLASLGWMGALHLWGAIALALVLFVVRRRLHPAVWLLAAVFAGQAAYSVYVGGDAWEAMGYANRYLATAAPALLLLTAAGAVALVRAERTQQTAVAGALAVLGVIVGIVAVRQDLIDLTVLQADPQPFGWAVATAAALPLLALIAGRSRFGPGLAVALAVVVLVGVNGRALVDWMRDGGVHVDDDARISRFALTLRETTDPDARIAVVWAGTIPYFSHRTGIDMLGKSDAVIAHMAPLELPLRPGHVKWDYEYTINQLRPDLVAQVFSPGRGTLRQIKRWGYEEVAYRVLVREDSTAVSVAQLRTALAGDPHASPLAVTAAD